MGYVIIHQTLCDLFPPAEFDPDATLPLTPADFITQVLVPETAVHLIMEDLSLPRNKAIQTLRESVEYGVAMFPADEGEGDLASGTSGSSKSGKLGATEQMFMDRARARRKELEEEERREEEELAKAREVSKPKPRPRAKGKASGMATDVESVAPTSSPPSTGSTKRKSRIASVPRGRGPAPGSIVIELSSDTGGSEVAGPSKRRRKTKNTRSDAETEAAPTDEPTPKAVKVKPRPRPKRRSASAASSRQSGDDARYDTMHSDAEGPPLISSRSTPFSAVDRQGEANGTETSSRALSVTDATPKALVKVRISDTLSVFPCPADIVTSKPKTPLEIAREKRQQSSAR